MKYTTGVYVPRAYLHIGLSSRLDHQPLFGKGARAPPARGSPRGGTQTRHERAAEIEPS